MRKAYADKINMVLLWLLALLPGFFGLTFGSTVGFSSEPSLADLVNTLRQSGEGKFWLDQALTLWRLESPQKIVDHLSLASFSRTDTVLTRVYDPDSGQEKRQERVSISLRRDQSRAELLLDLAHELVHACSRPSLDPYDPTLTARKYIWNGIEGEGGEVDAVYAECLVASQLKKIFQNTPERCMPYWSEDKISRIKIRNAFYQVGNSFFYLKQELASDFKKLPHLTSTPAVLLSSAGRSPYPVALLKEYQDLNQISCENSYIRLQKQNQFVLSQKDTLKSETQKIELRSLKYFLEKRCKNQLYLGLPIRKRL